METLKMARILNFDEYLPKRELDKITEFASKEFPAPAETPSIEQR
jgi:hypothetical protein